MNFLLIVLVFVCVNSGFSDRCDTDLHPEFNIKGTCMHINDCSAKGGTYKYGWCGSLPEPIKCCFIKEETIEPIIPDIDIDDIWPQIIEELTTEKITTEAPIIQSNDKCDTTIDPSLGKGQCMDKARCEGVYVDNWCESKPSNVKCCFKERNWETICLTSGGLFPHSDPRKFISCGSGNKYVMDCPPGLVWHQDKQWCDWPAVPEISDLIDDFDNFFYDDSSFSGLFDDLTEEIPKDRCDSETHSEFGKGECKEMSACAGVYINNWCQTKAASIKCCFNSSTSWDNICSKGGQFYPHQDPTKFIHCAHGWPYIKDCEPGYIWDSDVSNCVKPLPLTPIIEKPVRMINLDFLKLVEGFRSSAYCIPNSLNSGVTIGRGVDLGANGETELRKAGVEESTILKLAPYFGLKGPTLSCNAVSKKPLTLSDEEAHALSDALANTMTEEIRKKYNAAKGPNSKSFDELTCAQRTVISSVLYQYGSPSKVPKFWNQVTLNNWNQVITELRNFGDLYPSRRNQEADLLENDNKNTQCPELDNDICQSTLGSCVSESSCSGNIVKGFCQKQASSIRCCVSKSTSNLVSSTVTSAVVNRGRTVEDVINDGIKKNSLSYCSTDVMGGLAYQLAQYVQEIEPNTLVDISGISRIQLSKAAKEVPFIQKTALDKIKLALAARPQQILKINSALRTLPQQLTLRKWGEKLVCGIKVTAAPGKSPHEKGLAIDIEDYSSWQTALENNSCKWYGINDKMHFTCPGKAYENSSIKAFQKLWNCNNPNDKLTEDGIYGAQTEAKLLISPIAGFEKMC